MAGEQHIEGALGRVLHAVAIGSQKTIRKADKGRRDNAPAEMEQQFQYQIDGTAGSLPAFGEVTVHFDYAFYFAPDLRWSSLEFPHFTYGSHTTPATMVVATVAEWLINEEDGSVIGAKVAVGGIGTGLFTGFVHLTFQGLGLLIEPDGEGLVNNGEIE